MSSESLIPDLRNLKDAARELNAVSDRLNFEIAHIDDALKAMHLGLQTWVTLSADSQVKLGYSRVEGVWCICIYGCSAEDGASKQWAFSKAPRHLQHKAIALLPNLLQNMVAAAQAMTTRMLRATELASTVRPQIINGELCDRDQ